MSEDKKPIEFNEDEWIIFYVEKGNIPPHMFHKIYLNHPYLITKNTITIPFGVLNMEAWILNTLTRKFICPECGEENNSVLITLNNEIKILVCTVANHYVWLIRKKNE